MKALPTLLAIALGLHTATAQEPRDATKSKPPKTTAPEKTARWNVRVDVQMVVLPQDRALALLPDLQSGDDAKVEAAAAKIQEMIARKEATLHGWPTVTTLSGQRAVAETIEEKRYPTEFNPPDGAAPAPKPDEPRSDSAMPTAFETRNVGVTLEVEPVVLDDGKRIQVNLVPQRVQLLGFDTYDGVVTQGGKSVKIEQPLFFTTKITTSLIVQNGQRMLLDVHMVPKPERTMEFFLLRASATSVK